MQQLRPQVQALSHRRLPRTCRSHGGVKFRGDDLVRRMADQPAGWIAKQVIERGVVHPDCPVLVGDCHRRLH